MNTTLPDCGAKLRLPPTVTPIERVFLGEDVIAIVVRTSFFANGIQFFTPDDFSQQLAYMNRPRGHVIAPHVHNAVRREVHWTQEVLFIKSGRVRVDFYTDDRAYLESRVLEAGDVILLAGGGHGFEMLEPTEMIEVKQGPYCGDQDKTRFEPVAAECIRVPEPPACSELPQPAIT